MPGPPPIPAQLKALVSRRYVDVVKCWANVAPNDGNDIEDSIPLQEWLELQVAVRDDKPDSSLEMRLSFLSEASSGIRKASACTQAAMHLNESGHETWAYILFYEAALCSAVTLSLLLGWFPYRLRATDGYKMIDLGRSFQHFDNSWELRQGISINQKEWWAIVRAACTKTESWPENIVSSVSLMKSCDFKSVAVPRNDLQYSMAIELVDLTRRHPYTGKSFGSLWFRSNEYMETANLAAADTAVRHSLKYFRCTSAILKQLVTDIHSVRGNQFTGKLREAVEIM